MTREPGSARIAFALSDHDARDPTFNTSFLSQRPFTLVLRAFGGRGMSLIHQAHVDLRLSLSPGFWANLRFAWRIVLDRSRLMGALLFLSFPPRRIKK